MFPVSHLLLMEDDPEVASLYTQQFQDRGHTVILACTAEECLKVYRESLHRTQMKVFSEMFNLMMRLFLIIKCQTESD